MSQNSVSFAKSRRLVDNEGAARVLPVSASCWCFLLPLLCQGFLRDRVDRRRRSKNPRQRHRAIASHDVLPAGQIGCLPRRNDRGQEGFGPRTRVRQQPASRHRHRIPMRQAPSKSYVTTTCCEFAALVDREFSRVSSMHACMSLVLPSARIQEVPSVCPPCSYSDVPSVHPLLKTLASNQIQHKKPSACANRNISCKRNCSRVSRSVESNKL